MSIDTVRAIREAGVIGAGGAGFPTHVKAGSKAGYVIINGAECEPLLQVDQQLMEHRAEELLQGLSLFLDAVGAAKGVVALKGKYEKAYQQLKEHIQDMRIEIFALGDFYPAGDEQVLVREFLSRSVPEAGIPLDVDCVVINVETALNVAAAVKGEPVVDTWLTVAGEVAKPLTCRVPVGTGMCEVLELAGVRESNSLVLIEGGPMMGKVVENWDDPVTKTTKGLIVLPAGHPVITSRKLPLETHLKRGRSVCMLCARCTDVCPRYLLGHGLKPHRIMRAVSYSRGEVDVVKSALLCSECGACEYICPMDLSPRRVNAMVKAKLMEAGVRYQKGKETHASADRDNCKIPVKRLVSRLGIKKYDRPALMQELIVAPAKVSILLKQHTGENCIPLVRVGDRVRRGQPVGGIPEGKLGAMVHASIDGIVIMQDDSKVVIEAADLKGAMNNETPDTNTTKDVLA